MLGHYKARDRLYRGCVEIRDSAFNPLSFYIYSPPAEILQGRHGPCFHKKGKPGLNKYWIHFSEKPGDIDSGIIQIERDLTAALSAD